MCACCWSRWWQPSSPGYGRAGAPAQPRRPPGSRRSPGCRSPRPWCWSASARCPHVSGAFRPRRYCCLTGSASPLQDAGLLTIELPPWLLAASYAIVGWSTGLGFNRAILPARRPGAAPHHRIDPGSDGGLRRPCRIAGCGGRDRSADRLSRDQPGRRGFGGDHRDGEPCRRCVRDGDADHTPRPGAADRPEPCELRRQAGRRKEVCRMTARIIRTRAKPHNSDLRSGVCRHNAGGSTPDGREVRLFKTLAATRSSASRSGWSCRAKLP